MNKTALYIIGALLLGGIIWAACSTDEDELTASDQGNKKNTDKSRKPPQFIIEVAGTGEKKHFSKLPEALKEFSKLNKSGEKIALATLQKAGGYKTFKTN